MKSEEKRLYKQLNSFRPKIFEKELLQYALPEVLKHLFFCRVSAVAYGLYKNSASLGLLNRKFQNSPKVAYEQSIQKRPSLLRFLKPLYGALERPKNKYAMLKEAVLGGMCDPMGFQKRIGHEETNSNAISTVKESLRKEWKGGSHEIRFK